MSNIFITDGGGNGRLATVSSFLRLNVSSKTNPRLYYSSRDEGLSFNGISDIASATAGDIVSYLKNTSQTRNLFIYRIEFHSDNDAKWKVWKVTGTPAGTLTTPSNLNLGSENVAEADSYGNGAITGLVLDRQIATHRSSAGGEGEMVFFDAVVLPPQTAIAIEYDTGTTGAAEIDILFHYETIGAK